MYTKAISAGGHDMIDNDTYVNDITAAMADDDDAQVVSGYAVGNWANIDGQTYKIVPDSSHPIGISGIGTWDDTTNHTGWLEIDDFVDISINHQVKLDFEFDPATFSGTIPVLGGYIIDDHVVDGNDVKAYVCVKFANQISTADTQTGVVAFTVELRRKAVSVITPPAQS